MPSPFALRRAARANLLKQQLIEFLGGRCEQCGETHDLQINHIYVRDWEPRKVTHYRRVLRYWKEARRHEVNLLCEQCNAVYRPLPRAAADDGQAAAATINRHAAAATTTTTSRSRSVVSINPACPVALPLRPNTLRSHFAQY